MRGTISVRGLMRWRRDETLRAAVRVVLEQLEDEANIEQHLIAESRGSEFVLRRLRRLAATLRDALDR